MRRIDRKQPTVRAAMHWSTVSQETAVGHKLTDIRSSVLSKLTDTRSSEHSKAPAIRRTKQSTDPPNAPHI